jgi:hypothetical protein
MPILEYDQLKATKLCERRCRSWSMTNLKRRNYVREDDKILSGLLRRMHVFVDDGLAVVWYRGCMIKTMMNLAWFCIEDECEKRS